MPLEEEGWGGKNKEDEGRGASRDHAVGSTGVHRP